MRIRRDFVHHAVPDTDPEEARDLSFFQGCMISVVLGLLSWIGFVFLVRWMLEESL